MSLSATVIACEECGGTDFYVSAGVSVCKRCQRESRDHGIRTELDAESMGLFGSGASRIQSRYDPCQSH
jgi:hypothetical protein